MTLVLLIAVLAGLLYLTDKLFQWSFTDYPVFVSSGIIVVLYLFALAGRLPAGVVCIGALGLGGLLHAAWHHRQARDCLHRLTANPPFLIFIILVLFFFAKFSGCSLLFGDDIFFWGLQTKSILTYNSLHDNDISLYIKDYPPGMALFHYFFFQFLPFSEGSALALQNILVFAPIVQIMYSCGWNRIPLALATFLICLLLVGDFNWGILGFSTICAEPALGAYLGGTMTGIILRKDYTYKTIIHGMTSVIALTLFKKAGVLYAACIVLFLLADYSIHFREAIVRFFRKQRSVHFLVDLAANKTVLIIVAALVVIPAITVFSWYSYTGLKGLPPSFEIRLDDLEKITQTLTGETPSERQILIKNGLHAALRQNLYASTNITFLPLLGSICLLFCMAWPLLDDPGQRLRAAAGLTTILAGLGLYILVLLYFYFFVFLAWEAETFNAFNRYINSFLLAMTLTMLAFFFQASLRGPRQTAAKTGISLGLMALLYYASPEMYAFLFNIIPACK